MKVTHYHISEPLDGMCKQSVVLVRGNGKDDSYRPLIYLQRPKWITDDAAWRKIVASVQLKLPRNLELT